MRREQQVLNILVDGAFHCGEALAVQLGISRAAVWKAIRLLKDQGIAIQAVRGRGYRLVEPVEFLDQIRIFAELDHNARNRLREIAIYQQIDSTNAYLMGRAKCGLAGGSVCIAESQLAGRGRRGRTWISPYAANLYLSLLWRFDMDFSLLSGLSIAVGVAVVRALQRLQVPDIGLKWPNDLLWQQRKLGGILLEFGGESSGPCYVVIGVGLNVAMPKIVAGAIDQPWVDLRSILGPGRISRNRLAACVLNELVMMLVRFEREGLATIIAEWRRFDLVAGQQVSLRLPTGTVSGIARGVDEYGALLLETDAEIRRFTAGEVSLRFQQ